MSIPGVIVAYIWGRNSLQARWSRQTTLPLHKSKSTLHSLKGWKKGNDDVKLNKFLSMFKALSVNIPLVEALLEMPGYAKFMKNLVTKMQTTDFKMVEVSHHCSAIMSSNLAVEKEDSNTFNMPWTIRVFQFAKALCDIGASTNLMLVATFKQLGWVLQHHHDEISNGWPVHQKVGWEPLMCW